MSWCSIREFTQRHNLSSSTIRRHIQQGKISAKKFGRNWYIEYPDTNDTGETRTPYVSIATTARSSEGATRAPTSDFPGSSDGGLQSVVEFSSKALNHYLMMHEKLIEEKDLRLKEKELALSEKKQEAAELEAYVKLLEDEIDRLKTRPEGWR